MTRAEKIIEGVGVWAAYYRARPHKFAEDYLHLDLKLFQKILLMAMNINTIFIMIAARGIGKSFISAVFCVIRCILYPGQILGSLAQQCARLNSSNCWNTLRAL